MYGVIFLSFRKRIDNIFYKVPLGIVLTLVSTSVLISMLSGCLAFTCCEGLHLPGFSPPVLFISLLLMAVHVLIYLLIALLLFDNYKCQNNLRSAVLLLAVYLFSVLAFNLLFRIGFVFPALILTAGCVAGIILFIKKSNRQNMLLSLAVLSVFVYLLGVEIFILI